MNTLDLRFKQSQKDNNKVNGCHKIAEDTNVKNIYSGLNFGIGYLWLQKVNIKTSILGLNYAKYSFLSFRKVFRKSN